MRTKVDLSNLTKEQREYICFLETQLKEKNEQIVKKDKEIEKLKLLLSAEKAVVKKYNIERFVSKEDVPNRNSGLKSAIVTTKKRPGRKKGSKNFGGEYLEELSKLNDPITLDIATSIKDKELIKIDEENTFLIKRIKASVRVYKVIIPVYKDKDSKIYRAENNLTPIHHGIISSSLLSDAICMKYFLGVPEYRYAKWLKGENLPFSQRTLNNWRQQASNVLFPFYNYLKTLFSDKSLNISNIHIDETWIDIIDNKKLGREKSYIFCYSAKTNYGKIPFFEFSNSRETKSVEENLKGYDKIITVDGYAGYNSIGTGRIAKQRCMVHARREFANIVKTLDENQRKNSKAYEVIEKIDRIFHEEAKFKEKRLSPNEIEAMRNSPSYLEMVKNLNDTINEIDSEKGSALEKACKYRKNLDGEQRTYLKNGNVELDNNEAERQAKKFVIDRKNFLFAKSIKGAESSCVLMTLIDLAYENELDPRDYLEFLLDNIKDKKSEELLPWSQFYKQKNKLRVWSNTPYHFFLAHKLFFWLS